MKICILESSYEKSSSPLKSVDPYRDFEHYFQKHDGNHTFERVFIEKAGAFQQIFALSKKRFDVFINLCDGEPDDDRAGIEVIRLLEKFNLPFTGANSKCFEPSKQLQKMMAHYLAIPTPPFNFAFTNEEIEETHTCLKYPMIVKHHNGYNSVGITRKSKVFNRDELYERARTTINEFNGALIEEFIEGRELTVLVAENPDDQQNPLALTPVECVFLAGETFKHFDLKFINLHNIQWKRCTDSSLSATLQEFTKKMFLSLGGVGYARADFRVNEAGEIYFLEINFNCGIFYKAPEDNPNSLGSADFILMNDMRHIKFAEHIIDCAFEQAKKRVKNVAVRYKPGSGYGLYAITDIKRGELVNQHEGRPHYIVSKDYVMNEWKASEKQWFHEYGYPISDAISIIWSEDWMECLPINHSCDPNTWLKGMDLVARRDIPKGEQITNDYATYRCDPMKPFECDCKAAECRKLITGRDCLNPEIMKKYSTHISACIASKIKEN